VLRVAKLVREEKHVASQTITRDLYNGQYRVIHNPNARGRAPRYVVNDTIKPKGATTILGDVLAKKGLMTWPMDIALAYLSGKLPVVTKADIDAAALEHERLRDAGGSSGSQAHELIELFLKDSPPKQQTSQEAINSFKAFVGWYDTTKPIVLDIENVVYSPTYQVAGTYDALLELDGKVVLADWKTTNASREAPNGIYAENFVQLGIYALAYEEQRLYEEAHGGTELRPLEDLLVVSCKKDGKLDLGPASALGLTVQDCMSLASNVLELYNQLNVIKKGLKG
jgi:hypothetical protein